VLLDLLVCADAVTPLGAPPGARCDAVGHCAPRARRAGPFRCDATGCEQRRPRLPDDGTWECVDLDGAVVCHGGEPAAGVWPGPADEGWECGERKGTPRERVCVDLSPDFPDDQPGSWTCQFTHDRGERRRCQPGPGPALGARCDRTQGCMTGDRCLDGHCVPRRRPVGCWLDQDCGAGATCLRGACL
jgi:hypothetical protein